MRDRARAAGATTANIICAAWGLVLARVSGRSEAVFGLTRAGRFISRPAMRSVGCLINTLPVRSQLAGLTLDQLLQEQRKFVAATKRFEQTPLAVISELAETPKDTPLFDSLVMFDRVSPDTFVDLMGPEGKGADSRELSQMATAMTLGVYDNPEMLIRLEYDPQRFDAAGMERLAGYVVQTLLAMSEAGDVPLAQIQSLPDAEIAALLAQGAPADPVLPAEVEAPLIDLFEAAAARFPDHLAVETVAPAQATLDQNAGPNEGLSYHELDRRANHLAQRLRLEGAAGPDCRPRPAARARLRRGTAGGAQGRGELSAPRSRLPRGQPSGHDHPLGCGHAADAFDAAPRFRLGRDPAARA
ncbi:condensation domain-containing protein [Paracoccus cavernae]|uniref:Condensation domain-containing protein n=1 Tax=Paracoccus cavernae TaxID=1571207 RepID=A0ABT8D2Y8_9RHOB|nr:condensation domain-containing protein [Paracoccus cavernae]